MNGAEFEPDARREGYEIRERSSRMCTASRTYMNGTPGYLCWREH